MTSFSKASTGLKGLDKILDNLRLGDNVVWQVEDIEDYLHFVTPFVGQAIADARSVVYFRFGQHKPLVDAQPGVKIIQLDPGAGFEAFSTQVHSIVYQEGEEVFYVFDCLSDLLSAWATDLMIGNFFKVTCPLLFGLNTIGYFTVLRNRNSYQTIARIRETTQILLDVYQYEGTYYVHPLKVMGRYSPTMFLPHVSADNDFLPMTSSVQAAHFFSLFQQRGPGYTERKLDYWDRVVIEGQKLLERLQKGEPEARLEEQKTKEQLCQMLIGREERILNLACKYFSLQDLLEISNRVIGSGYIGGKTVGMLLARAILRNDSRICWDEWLEPHDSFYIGSDVYYTYLVENGCWDLRLQQKFDKNYYSVAEQLKEAILGGTLPDSIREQFYRMLEYYGQSPIIVRSSSLLEDAFGNAFAGKYESVFCVNQGSPQERYQVFEQAVKTVYASTMNESALAYRWQRGLAQNDEQMALLVQRVSGSHHARYFFPDLAGVAMSYNPYAWRQDMDPGAGMIRLVYGLGTRAVDRVGNDYPRIIALDKPLLRPDSSREDIIRFSQHNVDVLDTVANGWDTVAVNELAASTVHDTVWELTASYDYERTRRLRESGRIKPESWVLTFDKLLSSTAFIEQMQEMLRVLEKAYNYPVDTEFTVNFTPDNKMQLNLLQCRPLQTFRTNEISNSRKELSHNRQVFLSSQVYMGSNRAEEIKSVIYITPRYMNLVSADKYQVARLTGKLNRLVGERNLKPLMLIGPGRWGTTTPALGVPVSFAEICNSSVLVEVAEPQDGFMPELSFGTHFFQDLVETDISYIAAFKANEDTTFNPQVMDHIPSAFTELFPEYRNLDEVIKFWDFSRREESLVVEADTKKHQSSVYFIPVNTG